MIRKSKKSAFYIIKKKLEIFYNKPLFQITVLVGSIYILFNSDIEYLIGDARIKVLQYFRNFWFFFFIIEFIFSNLIEQNYLFSFLFFIDVTDLISLSTEVPIVWNSVVNLIEKSLL